MTAQVKALEEIAAAAPTEALLSPQPDIDYALIAEARGAKLDQAHNGLWRVLDQPGTVLWRAYFLDRQTAAFAYCLDKGLFAKAAA